MWEVVLWRAFRRRGLQHVVVLLLAGLQELRCWQDELNTQNTTNPFCPQVLYCMPLNEERDVVVCPTTLKKKEGEVEVELW